MRLLITYYLYEFGKVHKYIECVQVPLFFLEPK